jgi:plastocyanin
MLSGHRAIAYRFGNHFVARSIACLSLVFVLGLFASACGESTPTSPSNGNGSSGGNSTLFTIFIAGNLGSQSFAPNPLTIKVGQTVNWKNNDSIQHTATLAGVFDTGDIPPMSAKNAPVTMNTAGTFTYHCTIHPGMVGTIIVQP